MQAALASGRADIAAAQLTATSEWRHSGVAAEPYARIPQLVVYQRESAKPRSTLQLEKAKLAVRAGVDVVGHANYLDDEALDLLHQARHTTYVTPAAHWQVGLYSDGPKFGLDPAALDALGYRRELEETQASVRKMRGAGVRVLPGGDFGFAWTAHGTYARDLQNFVELFGYTPLEVLTAATREAGHILMDAVRANRHCGAGSRATGAGFTDPAST